MLEYDGTMYLPSSQELPNSDDTPVDNELQNLIPGLLKATLALEWNRTDWFFGVNMGIYYHPEQQAIVPDGFLSLGVERFIDEDLRLRYVVWEERIVPILTLEVVSQNYRGEYSSKKQMYADMSVLYYVVYSYRRRKKPRLEVYRLVNEEYVLQPLDNPVWLPEIGLGIGRDRGTYLGITREWLYWYNEQGQRLLIPEERILQAEERARRLEEQLRSLGVEPDILT